nr:response regulator transcription factor [Candidatus Desulfobacula maris]
MKLLIADDSSIIRKSLKRLLLTLNNHIQVFESGNVKQTLDLFQELNPDLIILDIMLPDGNGIDALKVIKQQKPAQKVMIYTAYP